MKRRTPRRSDGAPSSVSGDWRHRHIPAHRTPRRGVCPDPILHPTLPTPPQNAPSHPHRRGCSRRGLFRVLDHPNVFALLFAKNASCELLRAPRGILAIFGVGVGASPSPSHTPTPYPTLPTPCQTPPSHPHRRGCSRRGLFRVLDHPKVFALLFAKNASCELL